MPSFETLASAIERDSAENTFRAFLRPGRKEISRVGAGRRKNRNDLMVCSFKSSLSSTEELRREHPRSESMEFDVRGGSQVIEEKKRSRTIGGF